MAQSSGVQSSSHGAGLARRGLLFDFESVLSSRAQRQGARVSAEAHLLNYLIGCLQLKKQNKHKLKTEYVTIKFVTEKSI